MLTLLANANVFAPEPEATTSTSGVVATCDTPVKSLTGSYGSLPW